MTDRPKFKLTRLRDIGWGLWDPIGLNDLDDRPDDEYDGYLLNAAGRLWNGETRVQVTEYLVTIEIEQMGLDPGVCIEERARRVAGAISEYVTELRT